MDYIIGQKPGKAASSAPAAASGRLPSETPGQPRAAGELITDGDQSTFMRDVVDMSRAVPVLVDFWATWCGPCKQLTPTLEKIVRSAGGRVRLVKIDIDKNRSLIQQLAQLGLPMQSVPTVAAFWQGQVTDIFQGAQPESEVKRFIETLLKLAGGSMPGADLIAEGKAALEEGQAQEAGELFSAVLEQEPENPEAWGGLIRALIALGRDDEAQLALAGDALAQVPAKIAEHPEVAGARAALALATEGRAATAQLASLERRVAADPADFAARHDLATALNAMGRREEAADALLDIVRRDRAWNEGAARLQLLKFFEAWGFDDATTMRARRKLSALLFS
jgi:putative thioredoxin